MTARKMLAKMRTKPKILPCSTSTCPVGQNGEFVFHVSDTKTWDRNANVEQRYEALEILDRHGFIRPLSAAGYGTPGRAIGKKSPHVVMSPHA